LTDNPAFDRSPVWSPDGTRIAFVSDRDANMEIYVMNADGSDQTNLTRNSAHDTSPDWQPQP
jgi:TolB protein